jgi:hypothetical protein
MEDWRPTSPLLNRRWLRFAQSAPTASPEPMAPTEAPSVAVPPWLEDAQWQATPETTPWPEPPPTLPSTITDDPFERAAIRRTRPMPRRSPTGRSFLNEAPQDYPSHLAPVPRAPDWEQVTNAPTRWSPLAQPPRATDWGRFAAGPECYVSEDSTTCTTPSGRTVTVPRGGLRPDTRFAPGESDYHSYNIPDGPVPAGASSITPGVIERPTRGPAHLVRPASPEGTPNEATPGGAAYNTAVGWAAFGSRFAPYEADIRRIGPVKSYLTRDQSGMQIVVNVTEPGHPLYPGVVIRYVTESPSGATIWNEGTGRGRLQGPDGPAVVRDRGNNWVWNGQAREILDRHRARQPRR